MSSNCLWWLSSDKANANKCIFNSIHAVYFIVIYGYTYYFSFSLNKLIIYNHDAKLFIDIARDIYFKFGNK